MESSPRPGYYPDPSVPGYIRYWDGSRWVPGTSKPMPVGVGGADAGADAADAADEVPARPSSLAEVNFDDLLPPEPEPESEQQGPGFTSDSQPGFPSQPAASVRERLSGSQPGFPPEPEQQTPSFPVPPSMSELSFDTPGFDAPRAAPQPPQAPPAAESAPGFPAAPVPSVGGMGISISGGPAQSAAGPTPAQVAATSQALRIRLLRPDGKPFDGPEITTGPKSGADADTDAVQSRGGVDAAQRGPKKQAPKVVVKSGPAQRIGHALAVLAISLIGIVPLAYLLLQSVHDREDKLAAKISVPTKMNVLDGTSEAYLGGMAVVLLVVAFGYWTRLKRRRTR